MKSEQLLAAQREEIQTINDHYDDVIETITNPHAEVEVDPTMMAIMDAGVRGLERLKWEMAAGNAPEGI